MKNIKKFLYGFLLTTFVLFNSVYVFAAPGDKGAVVGEDTVKCLQTQDISSTKHNKATNYTEETQHNSWGGNVSAGFGFEAVIVI